jgi:hypothetical protein
MSGENGLPEDHHGGRERDYSRPRNAGIMDGNTPPGMSWTPTAYDNPDSPNKGLARMMEGMFAVGQKMWPRTDGAICWLRGPSLVRLELLAAHEYEAQLKATKEKKARESVPHF